MNRFVLLTALLPAFVMSAPHTYRLDDSRIPSYDTTYVRDSVRYRQIYINNGDTETFILIRNDSIVLFDKDVKYGR